MSEPIISPLIVYKMTRSDLTTRYGFQYSFGKTARATGEGDVVGVIGASTLDEAPDAYKPFAEVMRQQQDLVTIERIIRPLINVKG